MARKKVRKAEVKTREFDGGGANRKAIRTYQDVADSEDDFEATQDKILLDGQRRDDRNGSDVELSDEEVLALPSEDDEGDESQDEDDNDISGDSQEDEDERWGRRTRDYYNADETNDFASRKAEEEEALRIQRRELSKLKESDFTSDLQDWGVEDSEDSGEESEIDISAIPENLPKAEKISILKARNPELIPFAKEFSELHDRLEHLKLIALRKQHPHHNILEARYNAARTYLAVLAFYFSLIASGMEYSTKIREHEIMVSLLQCREAWTKLDAVGIDEDMTIVPEPVPIVPEPEAPKPKKRKRRTQEKQELVLDLPSDDELESTFRALKKTPKLTTKIQLPDRADHIPDDIDREDAQSRRRTLQFLASKVRKPRVVQSGDMDLPYRERRKDRETRLQVEAENRKGARGVELDDSEPTDRNNQSQGDEDEDGYYQFIKSSSSAKKQNRKEDHDMQNALIRAERSGYAIPEEVGKRAIGRQIEANKGLTTRKPKENRNARVKKRNRYEAAKKKLGSQKAVFKKPVGSYGGELSGINRRVVKSTRLDQGTDRKR